MTKTKPMPYPSSTHKTTPLQTTQISTAETICNLDYLIAATRGNEKSLNNLIDVFFTETKTELSHLDIAIKNTNYNRISEIAHKIKSAFLILGITKLEPVFLEMETLADSSSGIYEIVQLNKIVHTIFIQAKEEMNIDSLIC
jgi:HPt (histidine-containing phosphotransfer) domain-containing protein